MSNPYLAKLHGIIGTQRSQNLKTRHPVEHSKATAAIRMPSGNVTTYRKHNKPAFGPLGDSLDDFVA